MLNAYILDRDFGYDCGKIAQKITYYLEIYTTDLLEPLYESYLKSLRERELGA